MSLAIASESAILTKSGALLTNTGKYTGRAPDAKKIVYDAITRDSVDWDQNNKLNQQEFDNKLLFEPTLIHTKIKTDYLEDEIQNMINTMNSTKIPDSNKSCNNCAYARQRSKTDTL